MPLFCFALSHWIKEPLVHFLIAGALVFAYFEYLVSVDPEANTIVLSSEMLSDMRASWNERWRRPPTTEEFEGLIANAIKEEVFYREALRLGLDRDDAVVRNRMMQKMRFLNSNRVNSPNAEQLQMWFAEHSNLYQLPATFSFRQVYLGRELSQLSLAELLVRLEGRGREQGADVLDPYRKPLSLPRDFVDISSKDIARQFGQSFANDLDAAQLNTWIGPIYSGFGQHAAFISAKQVPAAASLDDARTRQRAENDWLAAELADDETRALETMLQGYNVVIE